MKPRKVKSPFVWSPLSPRQAGLYWMRHSDAHEPSIVSVYLDQGQWSYQYRDLDMDPEDERASVNWCCNLDETAQWAGPVLPPRDA